MGGGGLQLFVLHTQNLTVFCSVFCGKYKCGLEGDVKGECRVYLLDVKRGDMGEWTGSCGVGWCEKDSLHM